MTNEMKIHKILENDEMRISYREGMTKVEQIFESHSHTRYEMIAVFEGKVNIIVDNRKFTLKSGELAMIPPLAYHSVFGGAEILYKRATVLFDNAVIPKEIMNDFTKQTERFPILADESLTHIFKGAKRIFTAENNNERFIPLLKSLLIEAMYIHAYMNTTDKKEKSHPIVKAVCEYIDLHVTEKLTLDEIADGLYISKSTLSHIFKNEMKITPKQYILQKKMAYAAKLMDEGHGAGKAAVAIGYDNYANFYKMHKKILGEAPRMKNKSL